MALEFEDHPLWDYSLRVYGSDGVSAACIALQDRFQIDVNVVLFCSWVGYSGRGEMTEAELKSALDAVAEWNAHIVRGLRVVRQALRGGMAPAPDAYSTALRRRILETEVDCEHTEQLMLAAAIDRPVAEGLTEYRRATDALANISAYFADCGASLGEADSDELAVVMGAAFSGLGSDDVKALCRGLVGGGAGDPWY